MKKKFIHVGKRTLSVVLSIMMIVSTMLIGTITSVSAYNISNGTFYFVKPDGWTNDPRLAIGGGQANLWRNMYDSAYNIDGKIYAFTGINWTNYDGFFFADVNWNVNRTEEGNYWDWHTGNVTAKITGDTSNYLYKLNSGTSGAVTGTNDLNDNISAKVYLKSGDTFTENSLIASASASGKKIDNTTSTTEAAKYSSPTFTTTANDSSSYSFVGWYDSTNTNLVSENATYKLSELTADTELHAVYEAKTSGFDLMTTASAESTTADGSKIGTFSSDGTLTFSPSSSGTYYLYVDNGEQWFNNDKKFTDNSVVLFDYGTNNYKDTIKFEYEAGKTYTFKWESPYDNDYGKGLLSYTVSGTPVTSYKITASAYDSTKGTVTVDGSTLAPSGQTTTSNSSISIAVTPTTGNEIQSLSIGGSAITLTETEKTSGYTNSSYSISADTEIEVVFTTSTVTTGSYTLYKYALSDVSSGTVLNENAKTPLSTTAMTYVENDGDPYYYVEITGNGNSEYMYNIKSDDSTYYYQTSNPSTRHPSLSTIDAPVNNYSGWIQQFKTNGAGNDPFYIVFSPADGTNDAEICVAKSLSITPTPAESYTVTMNQGIQSRRDSQYLGTSYLDGDSAKIKNVSKDINDLTVTFTTETVNVANPTYNDLSLGYTGYMYQVYGYSINMTLDNGDDTTSTRVASVVNSLVDNNSAKPISALANGVYTCEYTFPSNIKSATVTPIFSVSADYAKAKGISYTAVYLKMTPGSNLFSKTYEPNYYTWRAEKSNDDGNPMFIQKGDKVLEREPEGNYGGQKMLYIGNNMYVAYVQSDLYGILFDDYPNSSVQTFDYNEFIKLQQLGYNNITFEPKGDGSSETVALGLNTNASNGTKVYTAEEQNSQTAITISDTALNNEFELDVDIEGYYIDVFGNRLQDTSGKDIKRSDLLADYSAATVKDELTALLAETGKSNELFGARYGAQDRKNTANDYGMQYAIYNYYVDGTTKKLISQQVSGYGTIEGAVGPNSSSMTNAAYMASLGTPMTYRVGTAETNTVNSFAKGYELIPSDYAGVPYLVSYKLKSDGIRVDGKWYYMSRTPQVTVNVKTSLLNDDGSLKMRDGKIVENTAPGSATVNYKSSDTIDQGTSAVMRATPNDGYAFVGFYEENGDFISKYNPYGNKVFAVDTTVYAVFKEVANGSVTITNSPYDSALSNPTPGGGKGKVSVTLVITPWNKTYDEQGNPVYGTPVTHSGETSVSATIEDGDKFHIILTGERTGADNFLAFRMPDKDFNGNLYYVALNDAEFLKVKKDDKGKAISATYTTDDLIWNWNEQLGTTVTAETKKAKTFNYYTDFSKTDINATLEYKYQDRLGKWKTYIVKNVPMDVAEINKGNYVPANSLVLDYAPPIDEVFKSCSWKAVNIDSHNSYALLVADQQLKKYKTYVDSNANGVINTDSNEMIEATFNTSIRIEAKETNESGASFKYWKRYLLDTQGKKSGDGEIFSNMRSISVKVTFDSYFEPVYAETTDTYFTNVQDAVYTREKSTDDNGDVYDYVYADFLLQYDTLEGNDTFKNIVANNPGKIKFGVILEMDYNYTYKPTDENSKFTAPTTNNDLLKETIKNLNTGLDEHGHNSGWNATSDSQLDQYNYYYNLYDLTDKASNLSVFGRYDYYFKFANTEANRARVYNAYSYIIIYNDNNQIEQIIVSNPKTLSIYATGIKNDGSTSEKIDTTESV